jgi:nucleotide-binding universal stress UspA family protein
MSLIDHIVCPVDMSPSTPPLLAFAATWARWYDADLDVLHAVPPPEMLGDPMGGMIVTTMHRPLHEVRADLEQIVTEVVPEDVRSSVAVVEGQPVEVILHDAHTRPRSMVIMGSHGRSGLDRIIHGSITATVAHHTRRAVLILPARLLDSVEPLPLFSRVLCAVDFLPSSLSALDHALQLAGQVDGRIEVLHVLETAGDEEAVGLRHFSVPEYHAAREHESLADLRRHVPERARRWCSVHERVATGHPGWTLLRVAEEMQADLIVMGSGDRYHLRSMWLGGATDRVIRMAHAPVLIVPASKSDSREVPGEYE